MDQPVVDQEVWFAKLGTYSAIVLLFILSAAIVYKLIRPYFSKRVTCWFCHKTAHVPYGNRNCWDCVHCEQYNGFTKDGSYNKAIPSQYDEDLNHSVQCSERAHTNNQPASVSRLCERCERNQLLKVRQLANFTPTNEARFDVEVEAYQRKLERAYRLCFECEHRVKKELHKQNAILRPKLMKYWQSSRSLLRLAADDSAALSQVSADSALHAAVFCLRVLTVTLIVFSLLLVVGSLPVFRSLRVTRLASGYRMLRRYSPQLLLSGLLLQLTSVIVSISSQRPFIQDLLLGVLWLMCYGHAVLASHHLLSAFISGQLLPAALLPLMLVISGLRSRPAPTGKHVDTRPPSPAFSNDWNSLISNHSDSGVGDSHRNLRDVDGGSDPVAEYEQMDCTTSELSTLNLGQRQRPARHSYPGFDRPSPPSYQRLIKPAQFPFSSRSVYGGSVHGGSVHGGSVHSFRTAPTPAYDYHQEPVLSRSPSRNSVYSQPVSYPMPDVSPGYGSVAGGMSTSPSVSNYRSAGSLPDSPTSTIYSHGSYVPLDQRMTPEKTSLITQILLGISLGINISIAAFILGRYSVNGDLLSFI